MSETFTLLKKHGRTAVVIMAGLAMVLGNLITAMR